MLHPRLRQRRLKGRLQSHKAHHSFPFPQSALCKKEASVSSIHSETIAELVVRPSRQLRRPMSAGGRRWWWWRVAASVSMAPPGTAASSSRAPGSWRREPAGGAADAEAEGWQAPARRKREAAPQRLGSTGRLPGKVEAAASRPPGSICFTS